MIQILALGLLGALASNDAYREVLVTIEPVIELKAISLRGGQEVVPVVIRDGRALVPVSLPLPWTLNMNRFEPLLYTQADLDTRRPLLIRQFGTIRGVLHTSRTVAEKELTLLLCRPSAKNVAEATIRPDTAGTFEVAVPAGIYNGAIVGNSSGTRIRSAIVVDAGKVTNIGDLSADPTVRFSLRVIDAKLRSPVSGATVNWDPPPALNAEVARALYAHRWSSVTDRQGIAVITSVGPPPIPVRWRIDAEGYAVQMTRPYELHDLQDASLPDIALQSRATISFRIHLPKQPDPRLRNAKIVLGHADERNRGWYVAGESAPLREGEVNFTTASYGKKRVWVESSDGQKLLYRDFDASYERTVVELSIEPIEIHGQVTRANRPVDKAIVRVADPQEAKTILGMATTDSDGSYRMTTFQTGHLDLYAIEVNTSGTQSFPLFRAIDANGVGDYAVDFDFPVSGASIRVVDAQSSEPLHAIVDERITFADGNSQMAMASSDESGRLQLNGFPEGTGHFFVRAAGHVSKEFDISLKNDPPEMLVELDKSTSISGSIIDANTASPVSGARITGGYTQELLQEPPFVAITDGAGRFHFDFAPPAGTTFYVTAPAHRLAITGLQPDHENVIQLLPPSRGDVILLPGNAPPTKLYLVMASPIDGDYIPLKVLYELAEANGMTPYQLLGTAKDGSVVLPEFLPSGPFNLYIALKGGKPFLYRRIGSVTLPTDRPSILSFSEK